MVGVVLAPNSRRQLSYEHCRISCENTLDEVVIPRLCYSPGRLRMAVICMTDPPTRLRVANKPLSGGRKPAFTVAYKWSSALKFQQK